MTRTTLIALALLVGVGQGAAAANPAVETLGAFQDWSAFAFTENGQRVCFVQSKPTSSEPKGARRGAINTLVTHRPAEKATDVVSILMGYPLRPGSDVEVEVDGQKFKLFVDGEAAWAPDARTDSALAEAFAKGSKASVKGVSTRGTRTTDTYSLSGFTAASNAIAKGCNIKR
ncbi:hypothetical protein EDC65_3003 [Stella humosa]|uniref:Invasion protein IalB n=1 Tax=Stella humosa TaxID=94 RepID=A0A3N1LIM7_9PROT|nr:invasion associated locus B family protein [Stella humosa]ROP91140.1 hypothetical protein EDC65_3003 [Stella humosa]BBK34508.1 hypothetical protein STHU_51420 [Stella humosa]